MPNYKELGEPESKNFEHSHRKISDFYFYVYHSREHRHEQAIYNDKGQTFSIGMPGLYLRITFCPDGKATYFNLNPTDCLISVEDAPIRA